MEPQVYLISHPQFQYEQLTAYLRRDHRESWSKYMDRGELETEALVDLATQVHGSSNTLRVGADHTVHSSRNRVHLPGGALEHASFTFVFHNVSRVFTHQLARHRVGTAISEESVRHMSAEAPSFWIPEWACADSELLERASELLEKVQEFQRWAALYLKGEANHACLVDKGTKISFLQRFTPAGASTTVVWSANIRALRHTIELSTALDSEEEIRLVFGKVASLAREEAPHLFADYIISDGAWIPQWRKI